jgi:hypothetical protein
MLVTLNLGDSTTTTTGALTANPISDLDSVYVSIGGAFGTGTAAVQVSFNGTDFVTYGTATATAGLIGPLPPCKAVRGNTTAHSGTGTISYRLGGNKTTATKPMVGEVVSGAAEDITTGVATTSAINVGGCGDTTVWLASSASEAWVGTAVVYVSFDGGSTWGAVGSAITTSSGATDSKVTVPRGTHFKVVATTNTSGTMHVYYGARKEAQI